MLVGVRGWEFTVHVGGPDDGPVALLLHGFPQHSGQWGRVTPALHAAGVRTVAVDQRGYSPGARPAEPADYALGECVADAVSVMDALRVTKAHVVGHDWGAAVAWALAARHPDRTASLTAISVPHLSALAAAMADEESGQREMSAYMGFFGQLDKSVPALLADDAQLLKGIFAGGGMSDDEVEAYVAPMRDPGALRAALSWYAALATVPPTVIGPVTVPTTYIWSTADIALGRVAAEMCGRFVTGDYRFVPLEGISHWVPDQAPDAVAREVLAHAA